MSKLSPLLQIPTGVKDVLPGEAWNKRSLEAALVNLFQQWSYLEVATPTFEFYEVVREEDSPEDQLFKFIDREGRILALRPDMTTPIARLVTTHLRNGSLPLRLFYTGSVFRYESIQTGRQREFSQAGVELIGARGVGADSEVIALAIEALLACSLEQFRIGIGQVAVTKGLIEQTGQDPAALKKIKQAIINKDFVGLETILGQQGCSEEQKVKLMEIATLHGSREVLEKARQLSSEPEIVNALDALQEVYEILDNYGLSKYIFFDFSILRDFDYYTGIVFEGYAPGLGYPVCGGGRYDNLLGKFGYDCPAIGFALGLERIMLAQNASPGLPPVDYLLTGHDYAALLKKAKELRGQGFIVEIDLTGEGLLNSNHVRGRKIKHVLEVDGGITDAG